MAAVTYAFTAIAGPGVEMNGLKSQFLYTSALTRPSR